MPSDENKGDDGGKVVPFPHSRVEPARPTYKDLGPGKQAQALGLPKEQLFGHWCSRCEGIWWGWMLEVECPVCGNRGG